MACVVAAAIPVAGCAGDDESETVVSPSKTVTNTRTIDTTPEGNRPDYVRACGHIETARSRVEVDIGEGGGGVVTCREARRVMSHFLRTELEPFRLVSEKWGCYESRPYGQGWDYHCSSYGRRYVDVAGGRRW